MARESRDQRLAREMREKHGTFESASQKAEKRGRGKSPARPPVTGATSQVEDGREPRLSALTDAEAKSVYDQVRSTPASKKRRLSVRTPESRQRQIDSVKPRWRH